MYKLISYCILLLLSSSTLLAFQKIEKDTSYTVNSAYLKYKKKFSNIEIVKPKVYKHVVETENIQYKKTRNRKLYLDAFINNTSKNPAIILIHGGGWKSGNKLHMKPLAQFIASKGYSCFAIEYRLSDEAIYPAGILDINDAIKFIKKNAEKFYVDTNKIAVLGASSGAQMATLIGTTNNNVNSTNLLNIKAIVNLDGILAFNHPESKEGKAANLWLGGTFNEKPKIWQKASALTHTNKKSPPILFINSQYKRFHAGRDDMIKILNKHKIYNQVKTFPNSPHTFWLFHPWFHKTTNYTTQFLDKILKDK